MGVNSTRRKRSLIGRRRTTGIYIGSPLLRDLRRLLHRSCSFELWEADGPNGGKKKPVKQVTGRHNDTELHLAASVVMRRCNRF
ncbi:hypothetical protein HPP92_018772 [Vanilla planifolia]|uniref:Uncharacterized protein n=1 Tax=Vanilla planifolia TaxID=51239 RepID=A0A835Q4K8_VANPL|nr:hypothetical protein HPP92_018772 [Vanilla planifolia]